MVQGPRYVFPFHEEVKIKKEPYVKEEIAIKKSQELKQKLSVSCDRRESEQVTIIPLVKRLEFIKRLAAWW